MPSIYSDKISRGRFPRLLKFDFLTYLHGHSAANKHENSHGFRGCHPERSEGSDMIFR
ncbi:MAG: lactocin 705-alpha family bacteriocin [Syntrophomonadaceae bacterium]|nr:lactocin 705-alpha family bacteriocin [Syntrophomonadaceae bacterium]